MKSQHYLSSIKGSSRCLTLALAVGTLLASFAVSAASVEEVRLWRAPDHTRLVFDLSGEVEYKLFTLSNPARVVIDIEGSSLGGDLSRLDFNESPISGMRSAIRDENTLRIVIDLGAQVEPRSFTLAPNSEQGDRLVVDLYDESPSANAPRSTITNSSNSTSAPRSDERRNIIVAISAGHGGEDPGGIGYDGKLREKNITLKIARALFDQLERMPGYTPIMIRDGDYYVELQRRSEIAREERADLFVAVHTDWYRTSRANGLTIYALSGDRADRENSRRVAQKENNADLLGGVGGDLDLSSWDDDVALTLVSLQMAWSMEQSLIAGTRVLESLDGVTRLRRDKVQQASLEVLKSPDIPSMLIETGYLTNPDEARRLNTSAFQQKLARGIAQGVMNYFYDAPPEGTLVAWQKSNGIVPLPGIYMVKRGDSLSVIAQRYNVRLAELKSVNSISSNTIHIGQELTIPGVGTAEPEEHTIRRGETLSEIAQRYQVSLGSLRQANNITNDRIMVGQILKIPAS
ncbi:MAG: N-acetylmuramoyl-L-alanine amidase [SAR86 cluster bacterium]|uniref:N-acetylmuramoyl-L-alanine amidase n=1 Tax=SAR86 cluster bacterium TaxID=2030880 RepID=A0A2A4X4M3_9GAMM|nr:MAG: N-acetylmuramoyl-L-alanine amidase [SAR86 cluster bacterium]